MAKKNSDNASMQNEHSNQAKAMSRDEQVGFHKGSLSTLAKERQELARILQIVEQLMQMHLGALKELGIDLDKELVEGANKEGHVKKPGKPIEDLL